MVPYAIPGTVIGVAFIMGAIYRSSDRQIKTIQKLGESIERAASPRPPREISGVSMPAGANNDHLAAQLHRVVER